MDIGERVGYTLRWDHSRPEDLAGRDPHHQDIRRGDVVIVFDPAGMPGFVAACVCRGQTGRTDQRLLYVPSGISTGLAHTTPSATSRASPRLLPASPNQLPSEGNSAAFKEFAWRFVNIIACALVALNRRPDYQQVRRYINDIEPLFTEACRGASGYTAPRTGRNRSRNCRARSRNVTCRQPWGAVKKLLR